MNTPGALTITLPSDLEIVLTRFFDAPRELVFKAMTRPEHVANWWGCRGSTLIVCEIDLHPGGAWRYVLRGPDGKDYRFRGVYHEIIPPERIVATECFDEPSIGSPEWLATVTLEEHKGRTKFINRVLHKTVENRDGHLRSGMEKGAAETFDRLEEVLGELRGELVITRVFDAPRDLVYKAFAEADRLAQWWGPKGFTMLVSRLDFRPGGVFHYSMKAPAGHPMSGQLWGKFVYHEIVPPERLVFVNSFSDEHGNLTRHPMSPTWPLEVLNTLTFSEEAGKTRLTMRGYPINATELECKTFEAGRGSMQQGFKGTLDQLAEYLAKG